MVQEDQDICQRQVDQLAKALKTCYETPSSPPISGFLKRDLARGKPKNTYTFARVIQERLWVVNFDILQCTLISTNNITTFDFVEGRNLKKKMAFQWPNANWASFKKATVFFKEIGVRADPLFGAVC